MNLLLLEPDLRLPRALAARMGEKVGRVLDITQIEQARTLAGQGLLHAVFGEADQLPLLGEFRQMGVPCAVWTSRSVDDLVFPARKSNVTVLVSKTHPVQLDELLFAAEQWVTGIQPGVAKLLRSSDRSSIENLVVSHPDEVGGACRQILATLPATLGSSRRLRLVLDELMTNSLHHGGGVPAQVDWGNDATRFVFSVRDSAGKLDPDEGLRLLDRHLHGEGIQDPRGRGLHLSRIYADRLYVSVVPGQMTESIAVFWRHPGAFQGFKPIWILSSDRVRGE